MDNERYNEIVTTYSPMVYRIALHDCRNHADAEDVMQNVFLLAVPVRTGISK